MPVETTPYEALRTGLIWGRWKSGERLIPQHLKEEFRCTSSVLREAMLRLAGEGFIISEKNHGFKTVSHSQETLEEAAHLRLLLEREAITLSLKHGDFNWEMALSAAHQKLAYVEKQMIETQDIEKYLHHWSLQDWEFHSTLISACGSALLLRAYKSAYDLFRMYAVSTIPNFGFILEANVEEHLCIYEAAIKRDTTACVAAIKDHVAVSKHWTTNSDNFTSSHLTRLSTGENS